MNILHLNLHRAWFDMIFGRIKREEYRGIKPYWEKILLNPDGSPKEFDAIKFRNGYQKVAPEGLIIYEGLTVKKGRPEWGAPLDKKVFSLSLGEIISVKNWEPECQHKTTSQVG